MLLMLLWFFNLNSGIELQLSFSNIETQKGSIYVAVYNEPTAFLDTEKVLAKKIVPVRSTGTLDITIPELPAGAYAISCFHDLNDNGMLDTNAFGIPTEPYGFSNNARPGFRPPNWEESKFFLRSGAEKLVIQLQKW